MKLLTRTERFEASLTEDGRHRLLVEAITDYAIYMLDASGCITSWNGGAQRIKGYTENEVLGQHFSIFYIPEDRLNGLPQRSLDTSAGNGSFEGEGWRIRKDGSRFWAHIIIDPIWNRAGDLVGFAKVTRDLTERKRSEDRLRASESLFRMLVQGVSEYAIYMTDPNGVVISWNAGASKIKGYSASEIIGRHFSLFYTERDRNNGEPARTLEVAAREGRFETEAWRVRKNGTHFLANVVVDPILADNGEIVGFAKVTRDLTQKIEAVGHLAGGIAHNFNNILAAVLGGLELIQRRVPAGPNITPLIDGAIDAAQRGAVLTRRMVAFGCRQELHPRVVVLQTLARNMLNLLRESLGPNIAVETNFPEVEVTAYVDTEQLELAMINLALNARDAMPDGGSAIVTILALHAATNGLAQRHRVCLCLTDTGEGMDEATCARATDPFFSTRGAGNGGGLGLSMVQGFAEQSGGSLVLKSRAGEGTIAEIWLPAAPR